MTAGAPHAQSIGDHPLTGKLVGALRHSGSGLVFSAADLETFRKQGAALDPNALLSWLRDLSTLAITLRNDLMAGGAAAQIEQGLIDPLCRVLESHARTQVAAATRSSTVEQVVNAERRKLERETRPTPATPIKPQSTVAAYMRRRRRTTEQ